jgi:D-serine deaminase-like pyridoxal phosphate-dependent protein
VHVRDLPTPALLVDAAALDHNLAAMSQALPGARLRPHIKAHKCSALAARQAANGHRTFTTATIREAEVLAQHGLGDDILIANEVLDAHRLRPRQTDARITLAVDSEATIDAAAGNVAEVVIDVNVGLPRCGCPPDQAGRLADYARGKGLGVRGVMGYEGHAVAVEDRAARTQQTADSMTLLLQAHADVGGDLVSAGGTGTFDINTWATEIQAGSYALMDTAYDKLNLPFGQAVFVLADVISVSDGWAVANCGLKAFGMDHGNPAITDPPGAAVWYLSDEHTTFSVDAAGTQRQPAVGDRIRVAPAHVDPTVACHDRMHLVDADGTVVDTWMVDMRGW